jgi:topoisomerase IA-like protein
MRVIHKRDDIDGFDLVVDITRAGVLGNPFVIGKDGDRNAVCDKHMEYLHNEYQKKGKIYRALLGIAEAYSFGLNIALVCYCAPKRCHGNNIAEAVEKISEQLDQYPGGVKKTIDLSAEFGDIMTFHEAFD